MWAYRNTPHESTKEKPSFLLFGLDLKSPTEASLLPPDSLDPTDLGSYREELILSLSSARELAVASIWEAQKSYKTQYDKKTNTVDFCLGDWVFVRFPEEETGKKRTLSRPWYGPFRIIAKREPNLTVRKVYFPEDPALTVHQLRVCPSPDMLPAGFYWYGAKRRSSGRTPTWLQRMLNAAACDDVVGTTKENASGREGDDSHSGGCDRATSPKEHRSESLVDMESVFGDSPAEGLSINVSTSVGSTDESNGETNEEDMTLNASPNEHGSEDVVRQCNNLEDLSALPQVMHDHMAATPSTISRYSLRDRARRQQPQHLMQVNSSDELTERRV